jgi:hypothetical protein
LRGVGRGVRGERREERGKSKRIEEKHEARVCLVDTRLGSFSVSHEHILHVYDSRE